MIERDKFLTEAMIGGTRVERPDFWRCDGDYALKVGDELHCPFCTSDYFESWETFGKLWEWVQEQEWWSCEKIHVNKVNPDRFANAVYEYLKDRR